MKNLELLIPAGTNRDTTAWATVTGLTPLRIRLDGEPSPLPLTPDTLTGPLTVGTRVWVAFATNDDAAFKARRVIIIGKTGGVQDEIAAIIADLASYKPISAAKTGDTPRTATSTSADPHLAVTIPAGQTHDWVAKCYLQSSADGGGDFLCDFSWTGTAVVSLGMGGLHISLPSGSQADYEGAAKVKVTTSPTAGVVAGASTGQTLAVVRGHITTTTASTLTLNWGLFTASGTTTLLETSSLVSQRRL